MLRIQVRTFASLRDALGTSAFEVELPDGATVNDALSAIARKFEPKTMLNVRLLTALNRVYVDRNASLRDGDELALLPPVSGGDGKSPLLEISMHPISLDEVAQRVLAPDRGAVTVFAGVVRGETDNAIQTDFLEYEAFSEMAIATFEQIVAETRTRWPSIAEISIVHRVGRLEVGETSVAIAVAAGHRQETFEACGYVIERLKAIAPIWKKEVGPDGQFWVEGPRDSSAIS